MSKRTSGLSQAAQKVLQVVRDSNSAQEGNGIFLSVLQGRVVGLDHLVVLAGLAEIAWEGLVDLRVRLGAEADVLLVTPQRAVPRRMYLVERADSEGPLSVIIWSHPADHGDLPAVPYTVLWGDRVIAADSVTVRFATPTLFVSVGGKDAAESAIINREVL